MVKCVPDPTGIDGHDIVRRILADRAGGASVQRGVCNDDLIGTGTRGIANHQIPDTGGTGRPEAAQREQVVAGAVDTN